MHKLTEDRNFIYLIGGLCLGLLLYCLGFTYLLVPFTLLFMTFTFVYPVIFKSIISRLVVSLLIFYGIYQLIATFQQFAFSNLGFTGAAVASTVAVMVIAAISRFWTRQNNNKAIILSTKFDTLALVAVLMFAIPFGLYFLNGDLYQNIARFGGIQAVDGINHWNLMTSNSYSESMSYSVNNYFPAGFHITSAFILDSLGISITELVSWKAGSIIYIAQYFIAAAILIYISFYFMMTLIGKRASVQTGIAITAAAIPSLILFFIIPFIYNGFLNHFYICSAILLAYLYLNAWNSSGSNTLENIQFKYKLLALALYYCISFGAATSWPLIAPPLILAPLLIVLYENKFSLKRINQIFITFIPVIIGSAFLIIPILFQALISPTDPTSSILLDGGLKVWHIGIFVCGAIVVIYAGRGVLDRAKERNITAFLGSFTVLVLALAVFQYFLIGEVRYYTIKTSTILELSILLLSAALLVAKVADKSVSSVMVVAMCTILVPLVMVVGITVNDNPLKEARSLFRDYSGEQQPPFFKEDVSDLMNPALLNKINTVNYMTLHYSEESDKVFAHTQVPFWVNSIKKDISKSDKASTCLFESYNILLFGNYTEESQVKLINNINKCADIARSNGTDYYIFTDEESVAPLRDIFKRSGIRISD